MRGSWLYLGVGCVGVLWSGWVACSDSPGTGQDADAAVLQDAAPSDAATTTDGASVDSAIQADGALEDSGLPGADAAVDGGTTPDGGQPGTGCITGSFSPYYGNFHAHTSDSDGEGTPAQAFDMARNQGLLDIQVVTDHLEQLYELWGAD